MDYKILGENVVKQARASIISVKMLIKAALARTCASRQ